MTFLRASRLLFYPSDLFITMLSRISDVISRCSLSGSRADRHARDQRQVRPTERVSLRLFSSYAFRHDRWDFSAFHRRRVSSRAESAKDSPTRRWRTTNNLGSPVARAQPSNLSMKNRTRFSKLFSMSCWNVKSPYSFTKDEQNVFLSRLF